MAAVIGYALRRTSARIVLVVGAAGVVWVVYRAVRPHRFVPAAPLACCTRFPAPVALGSSNWDLAVAALGLVVALVTAASLWRGSTIGR